MVKIFAFLDLEQISVDFEIEHFETGSSVYYFDNNPRIVTSMSCCVTIKEFGHVFFTFAESSLFSVTKTAHVSGVFSMVASISGVSEDVSPQIR